MEFDKQKELATQLGAFAINNPELTDNIGNLLLKKIQDLEKQVSELQKQSKQSFKVKRYELELKNPNSLGLIILFFQSVLYQIYGAT